MEIQPQQQQQQQPEQDEQQYMPYATQQSKADLLDKIKPDIIVERIRHELMGERNIQGRWVQYPALKGKAISEEGAWQISGLMLSASSQNVALSNLTEEDIKKISLRVSKTAQYMCIKNCNAFGIRGVDQLFFVHDIIFNNTYVTLKQCLNAGLRRGIFQTQMEMRTYNDNNQKEGFWSHWLKMKSNK
jgi:hypothetical protein